MTHAIPFLLYESVVFVPHMRKQSKDPMLHLTVEPLSVMTSQRIYGLQNLMSNK